MQFREQGKKIQCIRSTYDSVNKRSHQKVVATFDRSVEKVPYAELATLSNVEHEELATWFEARQLLKAERMNELRVMSAASTLAQLAASIDVTGAAMTDSQAAATWRALNDVMKALRRTGHPKPKRERAAVVAPGQADLLP
jgi:methylphosphotriester-DNA--protein-cysteine methyltransferase